jgi:hypothetical protein
VVVWNVRHAMESFAFQTTGRTSTFSFRPVLVARYVGLQAGLVTPVVLGFLVEAVVTAIRRREDPAFRLCAIFSAPLLLLATVISPFHWVKGNWLAAAYPAAHAVGAALYEEYVYGPDGSFLTGTFADYLVPTTMEVPAPLILHVETPSPFTPLGTKGVGEGNCMSTPVCLGNAVADALGIAAIDLPLTPAKIAAHLHGETS